MEEINYSSLVIILAICIILWKFNKSNDCHHPITLTDTSESKHTIGNGTYTYENAKGEIMTSKHNFIEADGTFDYDSFYYYDTNPNWSIK